MKVGMKRIRDVPYRNHRNRLRDIWAFKQKPGSFEYDVNMSASLTHMLLACSVPTQDWEKYGK